MVIQRRPGTIATMALFAVICSSSVAVATEKDCSEFIVDGESGSDDVTLAAEVFATAERAAAAGCDAQADRLLEGAHHLDPLPRYLFERVLLRERMGDDGFAYDLLEAHRGALRAEPSIRDEVAAAEARLRTRLRGPTDPGPAPSSRTTLDTVGPIVLGVAGAAALITAGVGMGARCAVEATDGTCLQGREPRTPAIVGYGVAGSLAIAGAVVWWVVGSPEATASVAVGPGGLMARF